MEDKSNRGKYKIAGKGFEKLTEKNMQRIQGNGTTEGVNISEHTFAAKILMKGGNHSG